MRNKILFVAASAVLAAWSTLAAGERLTQSWENECTLEDDVIGLWQFSTGAEGQNSRHGGNPAKTAPNGKFVVEGKFGGGLGCAGVTTPESATGAIVARHPDFSPPGAFSVELWAKAETHGKPGTRAFLVDNKGCYYENDRPNTNNGFMFFLQRTRNRSEDVMTMNVGLGFGSDSVFASSGAVTMPVGVWHHLAFTYDGAGTVKMYLNGEKVGESSFPGRGPIAPSGRNLSFGERVGSNFHGFTGILDDVCLRRGVRNYHSGNIDCLLTSKRCVFYRHEETASAQLALLNNTGQDLYKPSLSFDFQGQSKAIAMPEIWQLGKAITTAIQLDTSLRAGDYPLRYRLCATTVAGQRAELTGDVLLFTILNRKPPTMPIIMRASDGDPETMQAMGFTHANFNLGSGGAEAWQTKQPADYANTPAGRETIERLEHWQRLGLNACHLAEPGRYLSRIKDIQYKYKRIDRDGNLVPKHEQNLNVSHPDIQQFGYDSGASVSLSFGDFPNFDAAFLHIEIRDSTDLSFQDYDVASAEQFLGGKIPPEAVRKQGVYYKTIKDFPADRVIPDDYPLLRYYTWFWKEGDGWNPLNTQIHRGLKSTGRKAWTLFQPAGRAPSLWGSGGQIDFISQWTYSNPDPIKIGQTTDELFAMAEGVPGQEVMKQTQIIWYRSQAAPKLPADDKNQVAWERECPEVQYFTIAPDHLSEALWCKLSRPVKGILYFGWRALVPYPLVRGYFMTNPETAPRLQQLLADVVKPLGPTLLEVSDIPADIAILQSFSSQIFAGRGTSGWGNAWEADVHLILQWAGYQPRIIFDETIRRDGLDQYKILVLPACDVLTESVVDAIKKFQKRGGIIIADENLCPALLADVFLPVVQRVKDASEAKAALQVESRRLRRELQGIYAARAGASDIDIVTRLRRFGTTDYLFAINDKRDFGDYVGHHRLVMEKGLPNQATLTIDRSGYVYDLVQHQAVPSRLVDGVLSFEASFGPGEGRLFLVSQTALDKFRLKLPAKASRGQNLPMTVTISDRWGRPADAAIPIEVRITDAEGKPGEFSGCYTAKHGKFDLTLQPAVNDTPGAWIVTATNLATGQSLSQTCRVQ
ncbi:MAG: LamG domain-containing protein [Lentisphaerae bacterium]|nr:LamG domain-containing protein [Lentisphaerota bacterium]OQC16739.1 MAG: hypothetical protein BWX73_00650 [Lentisphaerae bacterium ADurb.Bin082]HQL85991.1 LamG domain-containing protein [Lentisphaeria bacterium]